MLRGYAGVWRCCENMQECGGVERICRSVEVLRGYAGVWRCCEDMQECGGVERMCRSVEVL